MATALLDDGHTSMVLGKVSASGTAALTSNDGSATLTDNGTGDFTVTFGAAFLSAPYVQANIVDATFATNQSHQVVAQAVATNSVRFHVHTVTLAEASNTDIVAAAADIDFHFMVAGKRNR